MRRIAATLALANAAALLAHAPASHATPGSGGRSTALELGHLLRDSERLEGERAPSREKRCERRRPPA
jgi:hypothetical protein